ncbi:MAG TPA: MBL fold metallo-hydrolase [Gammaproteobacteria bacterium]|nr:MBL fold metallo-hydrolase [Gammaproteobacteria bacterium]
MSDSAEYEIRIAAKAGVSRGGSMKAGLCADKDFCIDLDSGVPLPTEVIDGVYRLVMPLPFELNHINLYLLARNDGWVLVDCGLNNHGTRLVWEALLKRGFFHKPIRQVVVTHYHPDHIGLAAWLQRRTTASVLMTQGELEAARTSMYEGADSTQKRVRYRNFGLEGEALDRLMQKGLQYPKLVKELPEEVSTIAAGDVIPTDSGNWQVVIGSGHSPEQACLFNAANGILISGDHVLPTITPNISLNACSSDNPLHDYLVTLQKIADLGAVMYLPAHGKPAARPDQRIQALIAHHEKELDELCARWVGTKTVLQCSRKMFGELGLGKLGFAIGEAAAHLAYLESRGLVKKSVVDDCWFYESVSRTCRSGKLGSQVSGL